MVIENRPRSRFDPCSDEPVSTELPKERSEPSCLEILSKDTSLDFSSAVNDDATVLRAPRDDVTHVRLLQK